uniref:NADH dehydrogenase subunit 3 n=1 Tax=Pulchriphyllium bioculatum TaxID=58609 RepID=UPI0025A982D2|nr:NADH dehydrogenase subunit 3 [Pulchriphyllium bioculatum]WID87100.1 NADH dehydrogenase subunit 3 [Pulchriphyllium bioculatum]
MHSTTIMLTLIMMITNILMLINAITSKKADMDREKPTPIECGLDPKSSPRVPFSLKFFMIAMMFLIFDIEIVLIMPMMPSMMMSKSTQWMSASMMFLLILILGLYYEWKQGMLMWTC